MEVVLKIERTVSVDLGYLGFRKDTPIDVVLDALENEQLGVDEHALSDEQIVGYLEKHGKSITSTESIKELCVTYDED